MKNFKAKYPVAGTSALQTTPDLTFNRHARIIAFPERAAHADNGVRASRGSTSFVFLMRTGTAQGVSFGRMQRWQAAVGGSVFTVLAFASLLATL